MNKKRRIIVLSCMIALLAVTAVFNFILTTGTLSEGDSAVMSSANYFSQYRTERITTRNEELLQLDDATTKRVTFNEITKSAVKEAIKKPRRINIDLVNSQQARRILDRLVGYRLSPFISQKIRRGLSAGRVQSVAVRLIVDREDEINAFVPEEYWSLTAKLNAPHSRKVFKAAFTGDETGKVKIENKEQSDKYVERLDGATYTVDSVKKGVRKKQPMPPFITSTLQQDASHRLGFTSKRTMKIAQELYEGLDIPGYGSIGLITYMRTDSLRISAQASGEAEEYIRAVGRRPVRCQGHYQDQSRLL